MLQTTLLGKTGLDEASRKRCLAFLGFGPEDEANLAEIRACVRVHLDEMVDTVYAHLRTFEEARELLDTGTRGLGFKDVQREYLRQMVEGDFDAAYFESRLRVGDAHQRIELQPQWYLGMVNLYVRLLSDRLRACHEGDPARLVALLHTLNKVVCLDVSLAMNAYIVGGFVHRSIAQEYQSMAEVAERTLREKGEVEKMKADLTNMIVHDLKGPLGGILTVTQLALRKRGAVAAAHARHFEQIQRSARDLVRMIENLLEIDQMQEGRLALRIELVDIGALAAECADEFRAAAELAGQTIEVGVSDEVPIITTDRWLLRRVLNNLVVNAIRHSGARGTIGIETDLSDGTLRLHVRDSGRGIPLEDQATLFLKHRRRDARRQSREDTGLGLVFCKLAVEVLGGTIGVESTPGAGATFTVTLPTAMDAGRRWP